MSPRSPGSAAFLIAADQSMLVRSMNARTSAARVRARSAAGHALREPSHRAGERHSGGIRGPTNHAGELGV